MSNIAIFVGLLLCIVSLSAHEFRCVHDQILHKQPELKRAPRSIQAYPVDRHQLSRMTRKQQDAQFAPIRITFLFDFLSNDVDDRSCYQSTGYFRRGSPPTTTTYCSTTVTENCWGQCSAENQVTPSRISLLKQTFFPNLAAATQNFLSLIPLSSNLTIGTSTCGAIGGVPVSSAYQTIGVASTDLAIFVTGRPSTGTEVAWAVGCVDDQKGRSIAGQININLKAFFAAGMTDNLQQGTVVHELIHVLGFSSTKFSSFLDENGNPRTNPVIEESRTRNGVTKTIKLINTPNALKAAREHLNCNSLSGVELEEYGGSGSAGSHWEMRMYMDEVMVAASVWSNPGDGFYVSTLTLGLLQDSGWYKANFSAAKEMKYLRNFGCGAADPSCENWGTPGTNGYFGLYCNDYNDGSSQPTQQCSYNHRGKGYCSMAKESSPMGYYQHVPSNNLLRGTIQYSDFCPIVAQFSNGDCSVSGNAQGNIGQTGQYYGEGGICFSSTILANGYTSTTTTDARCFQTYCSQNTLHVRVGSTWYACPQNGGTMSNFPGYSGSLVCPKYFIVCGSNSTAFKPAPPAPPAPPIIFGSAPTSSISFLVIVTVVILLLNWI